MEQDKVLAEAKRLYDLGMAIHWLHPKSKRPVESGWTTGPRANWTKLKTSYHEGLNVGVRLGAASEIQKNFLAVIDVDVKSTDPKHAEEVTRRIKALTKVDNLPAVRSGRGNGSRHYYIVTPEPIKTFKAITSDDLIKCHMPSEKNSRPSKRDLHYLSEKEIAEGFRMRPAWEIGVMGDGSQVVLPPSVHPDSGKRYAWTLDFAFDRAIDFDKKILTRPDNVDKSGGVVDIVSKPGPKALEGFEERFVDLDGVKVSDKIRAMITTGEGVEDRSAMLMPISTALLRAGLTRDEILSVLTDKEYFIGQTAYHHAKTSDRARAANWVWRFTLNKVTQQHSAAAMFSKPIEEPQVLSDREQIVQQLLFDEMHDWQLDLDLTKDDKIRGTVNNVLLIMQNEAGEEIVRRDTFAIRDFYSSNTPWGGIENEAIIDDDIVKIKVWLGRHWGFEPPKTIIGEAVTYLATQHSFDPVREWLDELPAWDGVERLDGWLKNHFGAKGDEDYLAQVFRKWLVAMVMRIYKPGAKFDWMPIFEGAQGVGKSSFGRLLCGEKYFLDWLPDLMNKDSALALQGIWSVEMGELASFRKNEIESVKAFITRTIDKVRPPYGERWLEVPRRCVFFGTTNFETYLRDESGNRRFKPVKVGRLDFEALEQDRDQLFAEAIWIYKNGYETERTLEISGEAKIYEASIQSEKMVSDEAALMEETLRGFIESELAKPADERFNFSKFKTSDLFGAGDLSLLTLKPLKNWKYDSRNVQFAAKSLKALGAANWKSDGTKYWKITIDNAKQGQV